MRRSWVILGGLGMLCAFAKPARAQSELDLRNAFEGKTVTVKIDLPASDDGIDVFPQRRPALAYPDYAKRIKQFGTSVHKGDEILVTKVKVKKEHIEFQLGGGGYGTFADDTSPNVSTGTAAKTQREKNLEADLKREGDPGRRRQIKEEIDDLRRDREREDARNRALVAAAEVEKERTIHAKRLEGGSRINVRFNDRVPDGALTEEGLKAALEEWVEFDGALTASKSVPMPDPPAPPPAQGAAALIKGMGRSEVEDLLGPAKRVTPRREGTLATETALFESGNNRVTALFVEGVLVRYTIASR